MTRLHLGVVHKGHPQDYLIWTSSLSAIGLELPQLRGHPHRRTTQKTSAEWQHGRP